MKKWLLFLAVCGSAFFAQSQSYKTIHCYDDCTFQYVDTMKYRDMEGNLHPGPVLPYGIKRFGHVIGLDTSRTNGLIIIDIPDLQETDIYQMELFMACIGDISCTQDNVPVDSLVWDAYSGWFESKIICKKHGKRKDALPSDITDQLDLQIDVFPIPASDQLKIRFSKPFSGRCSILQLSGMQVQSVNLNHQENCQVDVSGLSGTYILVVYDENGGVRERKKIVVL